MTTAGRCPPFLRTLAAMLRVVALAVLVLAVAAVSRGAQRTLSLAEIDEAIRMGQTRIAADRQRFHERYRIPVSRPPVDYLEVVTPYRRVVLAADQRAQIGDRSFGQRQAIQVLNDADGRFDVVVEFTFHPLNNFVGMPQFDVAFASGRLRILPASLDRQPRFGARVEGLPPPIPVAGGQIAGGAAQPMLGGTATAWFRGEDIDPEGAIELVVSEQGKELTRTRIDLGRLR